MAAIDWSETRLERDGCTTTDVFATYADKGFRLGLNAAQTTLTAIAQLAGTSLKR